MKRLFFIYLQLLLTLLPLAAQKKEISAAQDQVKTGKDLEKAEASMMNLLKDSANRNKEKIWNILFGSLQKQYEQGNEKLYLKQKYDTASLFNIASRMFTAMETYDSIDALPDKKGKAKLKFRKDNAAKLNVLRPNLYNGGAYFIRKKDYSSAYRLFDQYIDAANQPLFKVYNYTERDKNIPKAAYWAVYCGYKLKDPHKVLHHTYLALKDTANKENMLQYLAATYQQEGDTARFVSTLQEGFDNFPLSPYFFPHLFDVYSRRGNWIEALSLTGKALKSDSSNVLFMLTKASALLNLGDYQECFSICDNVIKKDSLKMVDSISNDEKKQKKKSIEHIVPNDAYLYAGLAKFNEGVALDKNIQMSRNNRNKILKYYKDALPYLETYRKMHPKELDKWALPLYTIYLNLNMGDKFDEIDNLMKKNK